ncbi:MAG: hypothetical protein AB7P03_27365 [Kofleriaceae bacterium]
MKKMSIVVALVTAATLAFAACGKKNPPPAQPMPEQTDGSAMGSDMGSGEMPTEGGGAEDAGSGSAM